MASFKLDRDLHGVPKRRLPIICDGTCHLVILKDDEPFLTVLCCSHPEAIERTAKKIDEMLGNNA